MIMKKIPKNVGKRLVIFFDDVNEVLIAMIFHLDTKVRRGRIGIAQQMLRNQTRVIFYFGFCSIVWGNTNHPNLGHAKNGHRCFFPF